MKANKIVTRINPLMADQFVVVAGANPREKKIHDTMFGHYGTTFATVSFEQEYPNSPQSSAQFAAEYAEFMTRACNAYPGLVDLLNTAEDWLKELVPHMAVDSENSKALDHHLSEIRAALAKVGAA